MRTTSKTGDVGALGATLAVAALLLAGCASSAKPPVAGAPAAGKAQGAVLWSQNCGRCHNIRSPSSYSDAQWDVAMLHMRIRADLTAEEHHQILAFLKSAH